MYLEQAEDQKWGQVQREAELRDCRVGPAPDGHIALVSRSHLAAYTCSFFP